jgi:hypothetical protein
MHEWASNFLISGESCPFIYECAKGSANSCTSALTQAENKDKKSPLGSVNVQPGFRLNSSDSTASTVFRVYSRVIKLQRTNNGWIAITYS